MIIIKDESGNILEIVGKAENYYFVYSSRQGVRLKGFHTLEEALFVALDIVTSYHNFKIQQDEKNQNVNIQNENIKIVKPILKPETPAKKNKEKYAWIFGATLLFVFLVLCVSGKFLFALFTGVFLILTILRDTKEN